MHQVKATKPGNGAKEGQNLCNIRYKHGTADVNPVERKMNTEQMRSETRCPVYYSANEISVPIPMLTSESTQLGR